VTLIPEGWQAIQFVKLRQAQPDNSARQFLAFETASITKQFLSLHIYSHHTKKILALNNNPISTKAKSFMLQIIYNKKSQSENYKIIDSLIF